jgi:AAA domain
METNTPEVAKQKPQWPKTLIALVGCSGSGKSTSLRNFDAASMRIMDIERKGMPFRVKDPALVIPIDSYDKFTVEFNNIAKNPAIEVVAIDSITSLLDMLQLKCEKEYTNYDIWKNYNGGIEALCHKLKACGKTILITGLEEIVRIQGLDGSETSRRRLYVQGKEWSNKGIESECLAVWSCFAKKDKNANIEYFFATQTDGVTTAKSPMFWGLPNPVENCAIKALNKVAVELAK